MTSRRRIVAVLKSGPDFRPLYVQGMQRQLKRWAPDADFVCISDVPVPGVETIPLRHDWPDWWCKLAAFDPAIRGDFLLTDLDNVFVGPLDDILNIGTYANQRGDSNALAFMPEDVRAAVWKEWIRDPEFHMSYWHQRTTPIKGQFGDGGFIKSIAPAETHWEDVLPSQVMNIHQLGMTKQQGQFLPLSLLRATQMPKETRVLLCWRPHRPWNVPMLRRLGMYYEEKS